MVKKKKEPVDNAKVTITLSVEQAYSLMNAVEFYARIHIGQFDFIDTDLSMANDCNGKERGFWRDQNKRETLRWHLNEARSITFPELEDVGKNGSHGIFSDQIAPRAHDAWDIYQVVRHALAIHRDPNPKGWGGVAYDKPMSVSETNPLPTVTIE